MQFTKAQIHFLNQYRNYLEKPPNWSTMLVTLLRNWAVSLLFGLLIIVFMAFVIGSPALILFVIGVFMGAIIRDLRATARFLTLWPVMKELLIEEKIYEFLDERRGS